MSESPVMHVMSWRESAAGVRWNIQPFIAGRYRASAASEDVENIDPAMERPLCRFRIGHNADVDEAVHVARQRFDDGCWSERSPQSRAEVLLKLADLLVRHKAELALLDSLE